jgi:catechol 2,3-dioxygenase-like lactoylglutathione lyase family enzyme
LKEAAMTQTNVPTRITEIATILVPVSDQDRAVAFYTERLGFTKTMDATFGASRWIEVSPGGGTTTLALALGGPDQQPGVDTGVRLSTDDARADHAALTAAGLDVDELLDRGDGVPPMFVLRDQDGNRIVIVQQPPRS